MKSRTPNWLFFKTSLCPDCEVMVPEDETGQFASGQPCPSCGSLKAPRNEATGLVSCDQYSQRTINIASGRYRAKRNEPLKWYDSLDYLARLIEDPDGPGFVLEFPDIEEARTSGIDCQGDLLEKARQKLTEALAKRLKEGRRIPPPARIDDSSSVIVRVTAEHFYRIYDRLGDKKGY